VVLDVVLVTTNALLHDAARMQDRRRERNLVFMVIVVVDIVIGMLFVENLREVMGRLALLMGDIVQICCDILRTYNNHLLTHRITDVRLHLIEAVRI
jgi:hypothetical protein